MGPLSHAKVRVVAVRAVPLVPRVELVSYLDNSCHSLNALSSTVVSIGLPLCPPPQIGSFTIGRTRIIAKPVGAAYNSPISLVCASSYLRSLLFTGLFTK